ncbi:MAG: PD-(D/E)XK nuclease family transposase, partial [Spirochaetales bacterium]|nr:PD-(D/E)XK nuclease family transposase [Spirochaetales bacterium]
TDDNRRLSSRLNIYFIELPKLKKLNHLKLEQLTSIERWIKFLLYANDEKQTALIKKLSTMEEGIMQAKTVLDILSQDEINWYREWAEIKRVNDELTWKNAALREGREEGEAKGLAEGLAKGIAKGLAEGLEKGRSEGMKQANIENAISFYKSGVDFSIIEKCTGITKEQVLQELKEES